ncbi:MAG TPA: hypothetical protein VHT73_16675 [Thermodesulfobacteriota bacterium]|nr:hypothetical protein [Thermodesulfobacteriota bacterium]
MATNGFKNRLQKLEQVAKVDVPEIQVIRRIISREEKGQLVYVSQYNRNTGEYFELVPSIPVNKGGGNYNGK